MKVKKSLLFFALLCTLAACGGNNSSSSSKQSVPQAPTSTSSTPVVSSSSSTSVVSSSSSTPVVSSSSSTSVVSSSSSSTSSVDDLYDKVEYIRNELVKGEIATVRGVVVKHNYTGQSTPYITGFWLADKTGSIYVYGENVAKSVKVGNTVVVKGVKEYYIPQNDAGAAASVNYKGMLQLTSPEILENDNKTSLVIDKNVITTTTVKDILETPLTEDITGKIFRVKGRWSKVTPADFTNYYLNDLNRVDSIMAYTQSNGKDYKWTDPYDGKTVEMLIIVSIGKPGVGAWRMCPVSFIDDNVQVSAQEEANYAAERLLNEFADTYNTETTVTFAKEDEFLAGSNRTISSSSNQITVNNGETENSVVISASELGKITIEASVTFDGATGTAIKEIEIVEKPKVPSTPIAEVKEMEDGSEVTIEAVVAKVTYKGSMTPQGLFLADETGTIVLRCEDNKLDLIADIKDGNKVVVKGTVAHYVKNAGHASNAGYSGDLQLTNPEIIDVDTNAHEIPVTSYTESSITEIMNTLPSTNISSSMFIVRAKVIKNVNAYATSYNLAEVDGGAASLPLYSQNSGNDFKWLDEYEGQEVTIIVAVQNLNLKASGSHWRGLPIKVITE